jgi:hypothetical protein
MMKSGSMLLADRGYDADWIREFAIKKDAWANIPPKAIATIQSASVRISTERELPRVRPACVDQVWLRPNESTP